jgi:Domain of unknown function (DUF4386)
MSSSKTWAGPLMGVLFLVVAVVAIILVGEGQDATEKSAAQIVDFYEDNEDEQMAGSFLVAIATVLFVFFAGWLRMILRRAEGENGALSTVSFGGAVIFATGVAIVATLNLALADTANDLDPVAVQAVNAIVWDYYIPFIVGVSVFLLAAGISIVRHGALPTWLGWVAVVLGVVGATPAGFFALLGGALWILVVSILGLMRSREAGATPSTP